MSTPKYRIYPSLLDKFQSFLDSDIATEEFWNKDADGEYKLSFEEMADKLEQELIDTINRVPSEPSEAADKGTCFNEIVDCLIEYRKSSREDIVIKTVPIITQEGAIDNFGKPLYYDEYNTGEKCILAIMNGLEFKFDIAFCKDAAFYFSGSIPQHICSATINTRYGIVELYGYADEIRLDKVFDIKTTSSYSFGKYEKGWQKDVYPYCLIESGECESISEFEYTVFVLGKSSPIKGQMYKESYTYDHAKATERIRLICERFIEWLENNRDRITDRKIFNLE